MSRLTGRVRIVPVGETLATAPGLDLRHLRIPVLIVGAVLACIATPALTTPTAPTALSTHSVALRHGLQSHLASGLPITLAPTASASIGASERRFWPTRRGDALLAQGGGIHSTFTASRAALRVAGGTLGLSLTGVGDAQRLEPVAAALPAGSANQVLYRHGSVSEFFRNGPLGLEQGFTVFKPQASTGGLVLALRISGSFVPEQVASQILFRTRSGGTALRYGDLNASDAVGRRLPVQMQLRSGTLQLRIDDRNARYPLRIDPLIQQGEKLRGGGEIGEGILGFTVALSSDGNTALIGGPGDNNYVGAAWVFTRSGTTWTQQGEKLTGSGETDRGYFGWTVALSSDGNTALIGGFNDNAGAGAAWAFTRTGPTWTQQGEKLTGSGETSGGHFATDVALSSDGNTALIGSYGDNSGIGVASVFTRSGSTWIQQGEKLTGGGETGEAWFGFSVALSSDGNTAFISGPNDNNGRGAAWVFTRTGSTWTQQGEKLTGSDEVGKGYFGSGVALSSEGTTVLIGGTNDNNNIGAAWVFTRTGSTWTQQGEKLTGGGETGPGGFGSSVALASDGNTALIGGFNDNAETGAAWVFTRTGSTWTQQGEKLTGGGETGGAEFGKSVALSSDRSTALIGGSYDNGATGAAWVFATPAGPAPLVTKVSPAKGPAAGGTTVTIKGASLTGATSVDFGPTEAVGFTVNSATSITAESPAGSTGTVEVAVTTPNGRSAATLKAKFTFEAPTLTNVSPDTGPKAGDTPVTVTGSGFEIGSTTVFKFGKVAATAVNCATTMICTMESPAALKSKVATITVDVRATSGGKTSKKIPADQFTYG